jgi:enoyl-CoA hydratase
MDPHIKSEKRGALGLLTLNRPEALNALSHGMVLALSAQLGEWMRDDAIRAVAIRGEGWAFCAGGDIRAVQQSAAAGNAEGAALLRDEYRLNAMIAEYPKPYVALLHGFVMGGGAGVSVHGKYRLGDPAMSFAMPETGIGFIPDVGASYFLPRCPGEIGLYLALTGARIGAGDALAAGLVTHVVAQTDFVAVIEKLAQGEDIDTVIARHAVVMTTGPLAEHRGRIDRLFTAASVEAILERLDRDGGDFVLETAQALRTRSPTSLKLAFRLMREGASRNLRQCLAMEYALALRLLPSHDFREGVRAALIDKDRKPKWSPASLAGVALSDFDTDFVQLAELT